MRDKKNAHLKKKKRTHVSIRLFLFLDPFCGVRVSTDLLGKVSVVHQIRVQLRDVVSLRRDFLDRAVT